MLLPLLSFRVLAPRLLLSFRFRLVAVVVLVVPRSNFSPSWVRCFRRRLTSPKVSGYVPVRLLFGPVLLIPCRTCRVALVAFSMPILSLPYVREPSRPLLVVLLVVPGRMVKARPLLFVLLGLSPALPTVRVFASRPIPYSFRLWVILDSDVMTMEKGEGERRGRMRVRMLLFVSSGFRWGAGLGGYPVACSIQGTDDFFFRFSSLSGPLFVLADPHFLSNVSSASVSLSSFRFSHVGTE